jgi:prepilin-type N-terminal cleavage/methylation domain-containing protein
LPPLRRRLGAVVGHRAPGFSLIELLVVIGLIALLASLALVAMSKVRRQAAIHRVKGDFQAITTALEAYNADFHSYPMATAPARYILAKALIGPGSAAEDGEDGPGFRTAKDGKIWPSYLSADKFPVKRTGGLNTWELFDYFGNPIEYYPKRKSFSPDKGPLVGAQVYSQSGVGGLAGLPGMYDQGDGAISRETLLVILGDNNRDNKIGAGETARYTGPFILASPGADGSFSQPGQVDRSDDIYNFDR